MSLTNEVFVGMLIETLGVKDTISALLKQAKVARDKQDRPLILKTNERLKVLKARSDIDSEDAEDISSSIKLNDSNLNSAPAAGGRRMTRKYCKKTPCGKMGFTQKASCRPYKNCYRKKK